MSSYRAAYIGDTVLTDQQHANLSDEDLIAEAIEEAKRAGLIGDEWPCVSAQEIEIGEWME